jgi:hypothetical protein
MYVRERSLRFQLRSRPTATSVLWCLTLGSTPTHASPVVCCARPWKRATAYRAESERVNTTHTQPYNHTGSGGVRMGPPVATPAAAWCAKKLGERGPDTTRVVVGIRTTCCRATAVHQRECARERQAADDGESRRRGIGRGRWGAHEGWCGVCTCGWMPLERSQLSKPAPEGPLAGDECGPRNTFVSSPRWWDEVPTPVELLDGG